MTDHEQLTPWTEITGDDLEALRADAAHLGEIARARECIARNLETGKREWVTEIRWRR